VKNPFDCAVALRISMDAPPYDPAKTTRGNGTTTTPASYAHPSTTNVTVVSLLGATSTVNSNGTTIPLTLSIHSIYVRLN